VAIREYRRTGETAEWDAEDVAAYLAGKGYLIGPAGLGCGQDGLVRLDVDANIPDAVLKTDLDAYVPPPDPQRVARGYLIGRARAIRAKAPGTRTQAENDLLALLVVLRPDL
jgi:hypothetical protein